jgi:hypothetical protein
MSQLFALVLLALPVQTAAAPTSAPNTLTAAEKSAGWQLLFDGRSLDGWRGYRRDTLPQAGWEIEDGTLRTVAKVKGADLITRRSFGDFELSWEWRVAPGGNNGVKYFVTEDRPQSPGHEYQMIDDARYPGKLGATHLTAARRPADAGSPVLQDRRYARDSRNGRPDGRLLAIEVRRGPWRDRPDGDARRPSEPDHRRPAR